MTTLGNLQVNITGNNAQLLQQVAQSKAALASIKGVNAGIGGGGSGGGGGGGGGNSSSFSRNAFGVPQSKAALASIQGVNAGIGGGASGGIGGGDSGGGGGGGGNSNFFSRNAFGVPLRGLFAGLIIDRAERDLKKFADEATDELGKVRAGMELTGDAIQKMFEKIPVIGSGVAAGRSIRGFWDSYFYGDKSPDQIERETSEIDRRNKFLGAEAAETAKERIQDQKEHQKAVEKSYESSLYGSSLVIAKHRDERDLAISAINAEARARKTAENDRLNEEIQPYIDEIGKLRATISEDGNDVGFNPAFGDDNLKERIETLKQLKKSSESISAQRQGNITDSANQKRGDVEQALQDALRREVDTIRKASEQRIRSALQRAGQGQFVTSGAVNEEGLEFSRRELAYTEQLHSLDRLRQDAAKVRTSEGQAAVDQLTHEMEVLTNIYNTEEKIILVREKEATDRKNSVAYQQITTNDLFGDPHGIQAEYAKEATIRQIAHDEEISQLQLHVDNLKKVKQSADRDATIASDEADIEKKNRLFKQEESFRADREQYALKLDRQNDQDQAVRIASQLKTLGGRGLEAQRDEIRQRYRDADAKLRHDYADDTDLRKKEALLAIQERIDLHKVGQFNGYASNSYNPGSYSGSDNNQKWITDLKTMLQGVLEESGDKQAQATKDAIGDLF